MGIYLSTAIGGIWVGLLAGAAMPETTHDQGAEQRAVSRAETSAGIDRVLLLRNGNLMSGRVMRRGDRYEVVVPGAHFSVPATQVRRCCESAEDAYHFLRRAEGRLLARDHLALAQWCLRHGLLTQAARELLDTRTLQSDLPLLPVVERQLRQQLRLAATDASQSSTTILPAQTSQTAPSAEQRASATPGSSPPESLPRSRVDVSRAVRAEFARRIQPMLIQSCATTGCHAPDGREQFQLDRLALAGGGHATLTQRNLTAVLAELSADEPDESRLIWQARRPHGGAARPSSSLSPRQAALLREWAFAAMGVKRTVDQSADAAIDTTSADDAVIPATYEVMPPASKIEPRVTPRDRWDPAIFNEAKAGGS